MRIYEHFPYTGSDQRWKVPEGVSEATFECWGASGGMPSSLVHHGKKRQVKGGSGPANIYFTNLPAHDGQLGHSFSNNAGYAKGVKGVNEGEVYHVYVGGNGGPGHSTIKLHANGSSYSIGLRGGAGGWNGGGDGGKGAHIFQNLYNSHSTHVHYRRADAPHSAKKNQLWYDTNAHEVKECNATYTGGNSGGKWDKVTHSHGHAVGPSGGGGGGATDIRFNGEDLGDRILVAGGAGGAGGHYFTHGIAGSTLRKTPDKPTPPFGTDNKDSGGTGPDKTWAAATNYLTGGWGRGGMGGNDGPQPSGAPTKDGGTATNGGSGGPGTDRIKDGDKPRYRKGSAGTGGKNDQPGNGPGGHDGSLGTGGTGADASGGYDDFCAGGGGGGGGYYGGGGGGQGFKVPGSNHYAHTHGGGGGGGSNYAANVFSSFNLAGCARPPAGIGNAGTGANGHGGFARITYRLPPRVKWQGVPLAVEGGTDFDGTFVYTPAREDGAGIDHYVVGTSADPTADFPSAETTVMVSDPSATTFTRTFTAPAEGSTSAIYVKVVDTDGDASPWLRQKITGVAPGATGVASITSPAAGSQFVDTASVTWNPATQTPLAAFRLGLAGLDLVTGEPVELVQDWQRGGSRVNLATDPGFTGTSVWSSDANVALASETAHPGVSGSNGVIAWAQTDAGDAENHTTTWDTLHPGMTYRLHVEVGSATANDLRMVEFQVWDESGLLATTFADLSAVAAGTYVPIDLLFTPHTQGVYVSVVPSAAGFDPDLPVTSWDFEDATAGGFTGSVASDTAQANSGDYALKATGAGSVDPSASLSGAGDFVLEGWVYVPSAGSADGTLGVSGAGVTNGPVNESTSTRDGWAYIRVPFTWDGSGAVQIDVTGDASGVWYDDIAVYTFDSPDFGNTDTGQVTFLKDMLLELVTADDAFGFEDYFDGSHLNGGTGTVSWSGTANASPSFLTGTDVTTKVLDYSGARLLDGSLFLDTLTEDAVLSGYDGSRASISVLVNPSLPATPVVSMTVNSKTGLITLSIDANDGASSTKTTSFDVFRNGVRIATGLTPDDVSRTAVYTDTPGHAEEATYRVRAIDSQGGYADQTDGSVSLVG